MLRAFLGGFFLACAIFFYILMHLSFTFPGTYSFFVCGGFSTIMAMWHLTNVIEILLKKKNKEKNKGEKHGQK